MRTSALITASALVATLAPAAIAAPIIQEETALVEREPFLPLLGLVASGVSSIFKKRKRDLGDVDLYERDYDLELAEREPFLPLLGLVASGVSSIFKKRKRDLGDDFDLVERDNGDLELAEREPFLPLAASGISSIFRKRKRDLDELEFEMRNYFEDFEARNFEDYDLREFEDSLSARAASLDELD